MITSMAAVMVGCRLVVPRLVVVVVPRLVVVVVLSMSVVVVVGVEVVEPIRQTMYQMVDDEMEVVGGSRNGCGGKLVGQERRRVRSCWWW